MSATFRVGDRVRIPLGRRKVAGEISEDRGAIGVRGRRLYQILVFSEPFEPMVFELPEEEIEAVDDSDDTRPSMNPSDIINYLKNGGLISILRSNMTGGTHQPRAWLCLDSIGNITHTFIKERGRLGGEPVPFAAIEGDRIFVPKRDEVAAFLGGFGLDSSRVTEVLNAVGTIPR